MINEIIAQNAIPDVTAGSFQEHVKKIFKVRSDKAGELIKAGKEQFNYGPRPSKPQKAELINYLVGQHNELQKQQQHKSGHKVSIGTSEERTDRPEAHEPEAEAVSEITETQEQGVRNQQPDSNVDQEIRQEEIQEKITSTTVIDHITKWHDKDADQCLREWPFYIVESGIISSYGDSLTPSLCNKLKGVFKLPIADIRDALQSAFGRKMIRDAPPLKVISPEEQARIDAEYEADLLKKCIRIANDPIQALKDELPNLYVVGENSNATFVYLVTSSSWLKKPICAAVKAQSSSGKSFVSTQVLSLFPKDVVYHISSMSAKAIIYEEEGFVHRVIFLAEGEALVRKDGEKNDVAEMLRVMISEGVLIHKVVEKIGDEHVTVTKEAEGPIGFLTTTTRAVLDTEIETRLISVRSNESSEQTRLIIDSISTKESGKLNPNVDFEEWYAFAKWVRLGPHDVVIPYAEILGKSIPHEAIRARRDVTSIYAIIKASALINRLNRSVIDGKVMATIDDYKNAYDTVGHPIEEAISDIVPKNICEFLEKIKPLVRLGNDDVRMHHETTQICYPRLTTSCRKLAKIIGIGDHTIKSRLNYCFGHELLIGEVSKAGVTLALADDLDESLNNKGSLPTPTVLAEQWEA